MDTIIYIHCPEVIESPLHQNEYQIVDGVLRDICDILKYSFIINDDRTISYFGRKIDLDYKLEKNAGTLKTLLKYSFILKNRSILCECDITKLLDDMNLEKAFLNDYINVIKLIVKDIGNKSLALNKKLLSQLKFADLKRHYDK